MASDVREKLREAILNEEARVRDALEESRNRTRTAENMFKTVGQATEEISEELASVPNMEFTINPDSVWITLFDRELRFSYDAHSRKFLGEESGHSWYDGETYADRYAWDTAEECVDAMIRSCAKYARMARAIRSAEGQR